jgi:glutathione S-transferase
MLRIWGRTNSVNVQKVLWCCLEIGVPYERIDAGMNFGRNNEASYLAMNPNGRIPTIEDGDFRLWESNAIMRYLVLQYRPDSALYPTAPRDRSGVERWLDWTLSTLQPVERPLFLGYVRTDQADRDEATLRDAALAAAALWSTLDRHLEGRSYLETERFTLADLAMGTFARRWFGIPEVVRPAMPNLENWFSRLEARDGYRRIVAPPLS